jgi:hypothetical protein
MVFFVIQWRLILSGFVVEEAIGVEVWKRVQMKGGRGMI